MHEAIQYLQPAGQPAPKGHYSPGVAFGDLVFVSGQLPAPAAPDAAPEPFDVQVRRAMGAVFEVLAAAGSAPADLLKVTAYIVGVENWPAFNAVYAEMMGDARPARAVVPAPELHYGCLVEIEAIAVRPDLGPPQAPAP